MIKPKFTIDHKKKYIKLKKEMEDELKKQNSNKKFVLPSFKSEYITPLLNKSKEHYKVNRPKIFFKTEFDQEIYSQFLNNSSSCRRLKPLKKEIGKKETSLLYNNKFTFHKSNLNNLIPNIYDNDDNKRYEIYEQYEMCYKNKKKPFCFSLNN